MELDAYTVALSGGTWTLRLNGHHLGTFDEHQQAVLAASVAARMSELRGRETTIHVESVRAAPPEELTPGALEKAKADLATALRGMPDLGA